MPVTSRAQFVANHRKLIKLSTSGKMTHDVDKEVMNAVVTVLNVFDTTEAQASEGQSQSFTLPSADQVKQILESNLPAPDIILNDDLLRRPNFPILVLFETATHFGFGEVEDQYLEAVNLTDNEKNNNTLLLFVWIVFFLGYEASVARSTVDRYKRTRGSSIPFLNGSVPASGPPTPAVPATMTSVPANPNSGTLTQNDPNAPTGIQGSRQDIRVQGQPASPTNGTPMKFTDTSGVPAPAPPVVDPPPGNGSIPRRGPFIPPYAKLSYPDEGGPNSSREQAFEEMNYSKKGSYVHSEMKDHRFNGNLKQPIDRTIRMYEMVAHQNRLSESMKADFFSAALHGPALEFFSDRYKPGQSYESILKMMRDEYNSDARMLHVRGILISLSLRKLMSEKTSRSAPQLLRNS